MRGICVQAYIRLYVSVSLLYLCVYMCTIHVWVCSSVRKCECAVHVYVCALSLRPQSYCSFSLPYLLTLRMPFFLALVPSTDGHVATYTRTHNLETT